MRSKILLLLTLATLLLPAFTIKAQVANDTIYNPTVLYSSMPRTYEIAGITVEGAPNYDEFLILGYAGLKVGDRVTIPGDDITAAAKRLMRQTLFSQARIELVKTYGDKAWLNIVLRTQPRIASVNFIGAKKGEIKDLNERLQLVKGNQITQNIVNRAEAIVKKYYTDKGYSNADVHITLHEDLSHQNEMIVDINVDKHNKVKVHKIYLQGNEVLSDGAIKRAMKKTNEKSNLLKLFSQKKFIESDYEDDLNRILEKYNEKGYRDARIITDSVVAYDDKTVDVYIDIDEGKQYYIKDIQWVGNTIYPTEVLDDYLGMKTGDVYNQKQLQKRLMEDEDAVSNLYMDNGYLFYNLVPIEREVVGDSIVLEMRMMEGPQARINNVIINGNDRLYEKVIRRELRIRPGDLFSKSDLIRSMREIAQTGHFNPENMAPDVSPNEENGTVDIALNLESKANDQIEFSLGWGQTGIIGKLQLKFTNFSIKNLFYPSTYRGVIPQGEGQTFSIAAQTNARYYQSYSISFLDPWFGGRRPNSLSVSAYYARQTGVNSSYYNNTWANSSMLGYGYGLYGYGYGGYGNNYSDYFQSSYENSLDPNKVLQMVGVNVGFGKRLKWPDDWFTFTAEIGYNWYFLKNWDYLFSFNNGSSNSIVLGFTLARNSIDNPMYTRSGSTFSLNFQFTPPADLFGKKDWKKLSQENTNESRKELYRWIEYWKLRFKSRTYTPLSTSPQWTPVLMTRFDFGLLGSYNKYLRSPFETFYVGGDGMSGSYTYAQETIALRGYENGSLTPYGRDGYAYTRMGVELHFPLMLQQSTTIYALSFVEAGNAWTSVSQFNPFSLKRSAGAGVRIFLPMVGMMGIDWAYGFDKVFGERGGSHFHFILGQEF
ncbi:MAG: outer membrane protein assembly factor BamA [Bacteroidales bacterium]|nr:outer membrane protein assembly factor BamA [Bacteroidales bacterium]MBD5219098.1 outer membrane protein assembly factor BamA [Bacteroidales bacterium]